jgi:hypothetical protein
MSAVLAAFAGFTLAASLATLYLSRRGLNLIRAEHPPAEAAVARRAPG